MATYSDVSVNTTSGSGTTGGTKYTVPAGRRARVSIALEAISSTADIEIAGAEALVVNSGGVGSGFIQAFEMDAGQTLAFNFGGTGNYSFTAVEYTK